MNKPLKLFLKLTIGFLLLFSMSLILLVRFTDGTISGGDRIFLGYDEAKKRFQFFAKKAYDLDGLDGPYLIDGQVIAVNEKNAITTMPFTTDSLLVRSGVQPNDHFFVNIKEEHTVPDWEYETPERLIAISDIEGNFTGFMGFLQSNKVIDERFNWIFGNGHLVLLGDFVDRGAQVIPTLWLIYKLEIEAEAQGGKVHFILGNHEIMNIQGKFRYARGKYKKIARKIGKSEDPAADYRLLFSPQSELGRWLRSKNVLEKIGDHLFAHAGISPEILKFKKTIPEINAIVRKNIDHDLYDDPQAGEIEHLLMGGESPFWYRGMAMATKHYEKIKEVEVERVLAYYKVKKIVIGHTIVEDISTEFNGKVIKIDLKHGTEKNAGKTKGLLIENGVEYKIDDLGIIKKI